MRELDSRIIGSFVQNMLSGLNYNESMLRAFLYLILFFNVGVDASDAFVFQVTDPALNNVT